MANKTGSPCRVIAASTKRIETNEHKETVAGKGNRFFFNQGSKAQENARMNQVRAARPFFFSLDLS
ncbi:hypothetical protein GZH47_24440 [Paenibacillus rhizovicinus]|uniref:Uncharacterized protein n=1 Tax=Paenibacillus rhizovicinus TaxID=2704463 RepID=A0A6C0P589_9BACL|nr:hypothetical protein [Paenibacillus rhizovicinus]QHW33637.1 hypothetical protein GZH47_24440 [Paenibacillus rhizovicinus]